MAVEIRESYNIPSLYIALDKDSYFPYIRYIAKLYPKINLPHPVHPRAVEWCKKYDIPIQPHFDKTLCKEGYMISNHCIIEMIDKEEFEKHVPRINLCTSHKLKEELII